MVPTGNFVSVRSREPSEIASTGLSERTFPDFSAIPVTRFVRMGAATFQLPTKHGRRMCDRERLGCWPRACTSAAPLAPNLDISGAKCVEALERAGFTVQHENEGITVLARGYRAVVVPMLDQLTPPSLNNVLNASGLCYGDFVLLLEGQTMAQIGKTRSGLRPRAAPPEEPADEG